MGLAGVMRGKSTAGADLEINKLRCANWHEEIMAVEDHTSVALLCKSSDVSMLKLTIRTV